ncbi:MAG TPA: hypothetical protein VIH42_10935, partial [Thermoguttaceae bacterium]
MSPAAETVINRLDATRQKWWLFSLLSTCVLAACFSFGLLMVFILGDAYLVFSQGVLRALFIAWLSVTAVMLWVVGRRLMRNERGLEAAARRVESEFPQIGNNLINLVQLAENHNSGDPAFCEAAIKDAAAQLRPISFDAAAAGESRFGRLRHCMQTPRDLAELSILLGVLIALAVILQSQIPSWDSSSRRLLSPWGFVPSIGRVGIIEVTPKDTEILIGSSQEIIASIKNPQATVYDARVFIKPEGEIESPLPLVSDEKHEHYKYTLPSVQKNMRYRVEIGDSQTPVYTIKVREKPTVAEVSVTYRFPAYLKRDEISIKQKTADLEAPQCSVAKLQIRPSVPIAKGHIQTEGTQLLGRVEENGNLLVVDVPLLKNGSFTIHLFNDAGHTDPDPRVNSIQVIPDRPPTIELLKPPRQSNSSPGANVPVIIRTSDDHGLGHLRLEMKTLPVEAQNVLPEAVSSEQISGENRGNSYPAASSHSIIVKQWTDFGYNTSTVRQYLLDLAPEKVQLGQTVLVRAVVWDNRSVDNWGLNLKPQEAATGWHVIRIIAEDAKNSAALKQIESLRDAVWKILEKQIRTRVAAPGILKTVQLSERIAITNDVRTQQIGIQKSAVEAINSISQTDFEERQTIKRALNGLAFGEMLAAVQKCDVLLKLTNTVEFDQPTTELMVMQDHIIDLLRKLLDVSRRAQDELLSELNKRPGADLPDDVKQKLQDAREKLDKFLKEQNKIIEASENLAKIPVDDFTQEQEELLKALAGAEDDWSKLINELHSDLSKLPQQDFANSTLLKEAIEIQTELKMAEDALLKKTIDIAVPLEQLGYEMAEEMTTNIEKWLPDTPDREKWSQEESLTDKDKEAPMAELPGELEDLVGELMEEEEDLFDEMEDVSSSAADSLDKGAGWDTMDGPISNMSARGA